MQTIIVIKFTDEWRKENTVDSVSLAMVMRKEGKIVFMENKFLDDLRPGSPIAFQFDRYSAWPEHDAVEFSAQAW